MAEIMNEASETLFRSRVYALMVLEPNLSAEKIVSRFNNLYQWSNLPGNWLEIAAEEKQKIQRTKMLQQQALMIEEQL